MVEGCGRTKLLTHGGQEPGMRKRDGWGVHITFKDVLSVTHSLQLDAPYTVLSPPDI
jgi:hypothetical protein